MKDRITSAIQRVRRYHFENGFYELLLGFIFLFSGILVKPLPFLQVPTWMAIICLILTPFIGLYIWSRVVYPRSGYINRTPATVKERLARIRKFIPVVIVLALLVMSPILLVDSGSNGDGGASWTAFVLGLIMSGFLAFLGFQSGLVRLGVLAFLSAGLAVFLSPIFWHNQTYYFNSPQFPYWVLYPSQIFITAYFLLMALGLILSGGISLLVYLHHNPRLVEPVDEQ
jgi:hypothetical protein